MIEPAKAVLKARAQVLDVGSSTVDLLCHSLDLRLKAFDSGGHFLHVLHRHVKHTGQFFRHVRGSSASDSWRDSPSQKTLGRSREFHANACVLG